MIISFIPQIYKTYQVKSTKDFSWTMMHIRNFAFCCNLIYVIANNLLPYMISGISSGCLLLVMNGQKVYYDRLNARLETQETQEI